eukprot:m.33695 g.33695  ORF g.33695 m.33695 type:complete len:164 (-) comp10916_c0_seq1:74-565(-)
MDPRERTLDETMDGKDMPSVLIHDIQYSRLVGSQLLELSLYIYGGIHSDRYEDDDQVLSANSIDIRSTGIKFIDTKQNQVLFAISAIEASQVGATLSILFMFFFKFAKQMVALGIRNLARIERRTAHEQVAYKVEFSHAVECAVFIKTVSSLFAAFYGMLLCK